MNSYLKTHSVDFLQLMVTNVSEEAAIANTFKVLNKKRQFLLFAQKAKLQKPGKQSQI